MSAWGLRRNVDYLKKSACNNLRREKKKVFQFFQIGLTSHFHLSNVKDRIVFYLEPESARQGLSVIRCPDLSLRETVLSLCPIVSLPLCVSVI